MKYQNVLNSSFLIVLIIFAFLSIVLIAPSINSKDLLRIKKTNNSEETDKAVSNESQNQNKPLTSISDDLDTKAQTNISISNNKLDNDKALIKKDSEDLILQSQSSNKANSYKETIESIETFKDKFIGMKKILSEKYEANGVDSNSLQKALFINNILSSRKAPIFFLCFIIIFLMVGIALKLSYNKKDFDKKNEYNFNDSLFSASKNSYSIQKKGTLNDGMVFISDKDYSSTNSNSKDESLKIELKGRSLKLPSAAAMSYNINSNTVINNYNDVKLVNFKAQLKDHVNMQKENQYASKYTPIITENAFSTYNACSNYNSYNNKCEISFGDKNYMFGGKGFNLNDTVDLEEREEYTSIINYLEK